MRNLAGRSAEAAKDTAALIEESTGKASHGVKLATEAGEILGEIVTNVTKVTDLVGEIAGASREQADGIGQVTEAVTQMDLITQQNSALSEETSSSSEELNSQGESLKELVGILVSVISGAGRKAGEGGANISAATVVASAPVKRQTPPAPRKVAETQPAAKSLPLTDEEDSEFTEF